MNVKELLVDVFRRAEAAALAADPGEGLENDGGACNFDTPVFFLKGARLADVMGAALAVGIGVTRSTWMGRPTYFLNVTMRGQGDRRTKMGRAAYDVLKAAEPTIPGLRVAFYQQMD